MALLKSGKFKISRFENLELHATLDIDVRRQQCLILGNISPPDENLLELLLLAHTCKKEKAKRVIALLPYLAYTRADKQKSRESLTNAWVGKLFAASGIDSVITVDLHSQRNEHEFSVPITSLSAAKVLAFELHKEKFKDASILAPDYGALERCKLLAVVLGIKKIAYIEKTRTTNGVKHGEIIGPTARQVILHDDILDGGGTLISAASRLSKLGVKDIYVAVTHGLFTGVVWKELWQLGVKKIICTNSLPISKTLNDRRIKTVSISALLKESVSNIIA